MEPLSWGEIIIRILWQFMPVWVALIATFALSITFKRRLGLYGKLFDSTIGMIGFGIVMFWIFTGFFAMFDLIATHDPLSQVSGMKNKLPGTPLNGAEEKITSPCASWIVLPSKRPSMLTLLLRAAYFSFIVILPRKKNYIHCSLLSTQSSENCCI